MFILNQMHVLAQGENSAGESQVNFRVYVSRESRVRVPSGIWVDRKRWGKKNDINIPNIPGEERDALLAKRTKLKELVDVIETSVEAADDKSTVTREWLEKLIRRTLRPKTCSGIIRVDYIVTAGEKINLLEVNTTPGMTTTSFIPQQVRAAGLDIKDVMTDIIENKF